jgi:hypothetical protein
LERLRFVPVFVRNGENAGRGNSALLQRGARAWPNPESGAELEKALAGAANAVAAEPKQDTLGLSVREDPDGTAKPPTTSFPKLSPRSPADELFDAVQNILIRELSKPLSETEVAELLAVSKAQAKAWLKELLQRGVIEKLNKPVRYRAVTTQSLL